VTPADLASCTATLSVGGSPVDSGPGTACPLGSPLAAFAYCANHLNGRGRMLQKGQVVICGAIAKHKPTPEALAALAGVPIVADFGALGALTTVLAP
jgi:2-keto-4-pentenoate hydratase